MSRLRSIWETVNRAMGSKQTTGIRAETDEAGAVIAEPEAPQGGAGDAAAPQRTWAPRSRKSIREEEALQKECARCKALAGRAEDNLSGFAKEKARALGLLKDGESWADALLRQTLRNIQDEEGRLAAVKEIAAKAQADLQNFRASLEAYAPERSRIQNTLSDLAAARLEVDCALEKLLREALATLKLREETTDLMRQQGAAIELTCSFEAGVPASLHEALSLEIVAASKVWNARFLGKEDNLKPYVVVDPTFEPEETLARKAIYHFGETVFLLEDEAREFLRNDRPQPGGRGWECLPPTLMTAEAFAAAKAEAGPNGSMMKYVLQQKHGELEQKRRQGYLEERRGMPVPGLRYGER